MWAFTQPEAQEIHMREVITEEVEKKAFEIEKHNLASTALIRGKQYHERKAALEQKYAELSQKDAMDTSNQPVQKTPAEPKTVPVTDLDTTVTASPVAYSPLTTAKKFESLKKSHLTADLDMLGG